MRVQWKVHRRNVIIIVARFAYVTSEGKGERSVGTLGEERGEAGSYCTEAE